MAILVLDPIFEEKVKEMRGVHDLDEVWDGILVMAALHDIEHRSIAGEFCFAFGSTMGDRRAGKFYLGVNVSDRDEGWLENYRIPDVAIYLANNPARNCDTHWLGGPDLAVEVICPQDRTRDKLPFYASVGVRELLIVDRDPWALEVYRLAGGSLDLAARVTPESAESIRLDVLPLTIRLVAGEGRPEIEVAHQSDGRTWTI
jgi:Uma2 family endonuclease